MKVVQVNTTGKSGSTGKICLSISSVLNQRDIENYVFFTQGTAKKDNFIKFANEKYKKVQALKSRVFGNYGFNSNFATKRLIKNLDIIKPDIVHLHNIHGHDVNLKMLLNYLKNHNIKVYWTFHDCWSFTGYCTYFTMAKCDKWKSECEKCPQYKMYSWFFDKSKKMFNLKKQAIEGLDLTIITPSKWLADLVKQSFFKDYPIKVINNGIDLSIFKPTESDFREKYNLQDNKIVLGVASGWEKRKGLDVIIDIANRLDDSYRVILVGTNDKIDKILPSSIISIHRTENQVELAKLYTIANVFINPTREDNYPTVNMEAIACGTPVITFKTGGSPEMLDEKCGVVVDCDDIDAMLKEIIRVCEEQPLKKEACLIKAKCFDMDDKFLEYIELYRNETK